MTRDGIFGWSYPAGCNGPSVHEGQEPSDLVNELLETLEDAGVPERIIDQIVKLVEEWELAQADNCDYGAEAQLDEQEARIREAEREAEVDNEKRLRRKRQEES